MRLNQKQLEKKLLDLEKQLKEKMGQIKNVYEPPRKFVDYCKTLKIRSGVQLMPFQLYDYQMKLNDCINKRRKVQVIKCRQTGITAFLLAKASHKAVTDPAFLATIFAQNQGDTSEFAVRLHNMVYSLKNAGLHMLTYNKLEFSPRNGGRILFRNSASENARSIPSVTYNIFDEAAFPPNIDLLYAASIPAQSMVGDDARTIIVSSPNGVGNWFYNQMVDGNECDILQIIEDIRKGKLPPYYEVIDKAGNAKVIIHWRAHPIYGKQEDYLERVQAQTGLSWDKVLQEYDLDFTQSDEMVFASDHVRNALEDEQIPVDWCDAIFIGVDVATTGEDYTVATVLGMIDDSLYVLDMYRQKKQTSQYDIFKIGDLIEKYDPDCVLVEKNHAGSVYIEDLIEHHPDVLIKGMTTTRQSKESYISRLKLALERESVKFPSTYPIRDELLQFRREPSGKLTAPRGKNDDCVISLALGLTAYATELDDGMLRLLLKK